MLLGSHCGERSSQNVSIGEKREAEATFAGYESDFRNEQKSKHSAAVALSSVALQGERRN